MTPHASPPNASPPARRRWLAHPWLSAFIAAAWLLMQGSLAPGDLLWAALMALVLPWLLSGFIGTRSRPRRVGVMVKLVFTVLWDIVVANVAVARIVVNPRSDPQPAWVPVRHSLEDPNAIMLLAAIITTTPGTVSCVIDEDRQEILVHALDAADPEAIAADILQRYERPLKEIFG